MRKLENKRIALTGTLLALAALPLHGTQMRSVLDGIVLVDSAQAQATDPQPRFAEETPESSQDSRYDERRPGRLSQTEEGMPRGSRFFAGREHGAPDRAMGHKGGWFKDLLRELDLSAEQREKMRALKQDRSEKIEEMRALFAQRAELKQMLFTPESTEAQIRQKLKLIQEAALKMSERKIEKMLALRQILSADQLALLAKRMQEKRSELRHGEGFGPDAGHARDSWRGKFKERARAWTTRPEGEDAKRRGAPPPEETAGRDSEQELELFDGF